MKDNPFNPGDYICYTMKNELGKVKRLANDNDVFAWFHCGDTASRISNDLFSLVLSHREAQKMSEEAIMKYLKSYGFSNDYAIADIVRK